MLMPEAEKSWSRVGPYPKLELPDFSMPRACTTMT